MNHTPHRSVPPASVPALAPLEPRLLLATTILNPNPLPPTPQTATIGHFARNGGKVLFQNDDGIHGPELWATDGTQAGTTLVKDIRPGKQGSLSLGARYASEPSPTPYLATFNGYTYFTADDGTGRALWKSNGTAAGTSRVRPLPPAAGASTDQARFTPGSGALYFTIGYNEIWKTDGTAAGTVQLRQFTSADYFDRIDTLTPVGNTLYFLKHQGADPVELWKSNNTPAGTVQVSTPATVNSITAFKGKLIIASAHGCWSVDPATSVTTQIVGDHPNAENGQLVGHTVLNDRFIFYRTAPVPDNRDTRHELWSTDGTPAGTMRLFAGRNRSNSTGFHVMPDAVVYYFYTGPAAPYHFRTDGTLANTVPYTGQFPEPGVVFQDATYYVRDGKFWKYNGQGNPATYIADVPTDNPDYAIADELTPFGDCLVYIAPHPFRGRELWTLNPSARKKNRPIVAIQPQITRTATHLAIRGTSWNDNIRVTADPAAGTLTVDWNLFTAAHTSPLQGLESLSISGGNGSDTITLVGALPGATLWGDAGSDTLTGGDGPDLLRGNEGWDRLIGGAGHDTLRGDDDDDDLYGGPGNDLLRGDDGQDDLFGDDGNDSLYGQHGGDDLHGGAGSDLLAGGENGAVGDSIVTFVYDTAEYTDRTEDLFLSADGRARDGAPGERDNILPDVERIRSGAGNDYLVATPTGYALRGGPGNDTLVGSDSYDYLNGEAGNDLLLANAGDDTLLGEDGNDRLLGHAGNDSLTGGNGNDTLDAGTGDDNLISNDDGKIPDLLLGGNGRDSARLTRHDSRSSIEELLA